MAEMLRGATPRRELLRAGLTGFSSLTLADLLRRRAQSAPTTAERTAVILVWLRGGQSHLEIGRAHV